jgi:hypothetical protein
MYGMFLTVRSFLNKDFEKKLAEMKMKNTEIVLPIRLQAYERMSLFLERIALPNLIMRINEPAYNVAVLQHKMLSEIREEYNHNLSQQIYMSDQAWTLIKSSMEEVVSIINRASVSLEQDSKSIELAKAILEILVQKNEDPVNKAVKFIKKEIQLVF